MLYVGDLSFEKGIHVLIRAFSELRDRAPLVMIGRAVEPLANIRLPPTVRVLETLEHGSALAAFERCTVAVVPSVWPEPSGLVALEAMAMSKPVVASRAGGLSETVVDGETGLLVEPGDHEALREALARLLVDADLRRRQGAAGRERIVTRFGADVVVPQFESAYESLVPGGVER